MQGAQDFQRLFRVGDLGIHQSRLECADVALRVTRRTVPSGWHDALVVVDFAILDDHPMPQRAARGFGGADAFSFFGPSGRLPFCGVGGAQIARLDRRHQFILEVLHQMGAILGLQTPRRSAAQG